uniref:Info leucine-rich repeat, immunoglobulin-like and transmembrane domains 3a n=1 Tax=Callorhinchus milii TaxID=7868 RepID=A0A4W3HIP9_CALMI
MYLLAVLCMLVTFLANVSSFCPSQCTCIYHGRSDGSGTRSVVCNDPDMSEIPVNVPVDTVKLCVEKTVVRQLPREAFYYLVDLKYLWLTYNAISTINPRSFYNLKQVHELRLDGNTLSSFPWDSLQEMPHLRTFYLHNNRLATIPAEAARYLKNITHLDISSNKLTTLPSDLLDLWPAYSRNTMFRVILALQDNPWYCDCRISKIIELSKLEETWVVLLDPLITCSGPENIAGVYFHKVELEQCLKPSIMTSATKITSPLGSNVLLRCDSTGFPTPNLVWFRTDVLPVNYTVIQESPGDGIRWSIISLTGVSYKDAGEYRCKAKNLAGTSEAAITLTVVGTVTTTVPPQRKDFLWSTKEHTLANSSPKTSHVNESKKVRGPLLNTTSVQSVSIKNLRVISETDQKVLVTWKTSNYKSGPALNLLYSKYGEKTMQKINIDSGESKVSIDRLTPNTKYMACICPKGMKPKKEQCVVFSTEQENNTKSYQTLLNIVVICIGCAVTLPILFMVVYVVVKAQCKRKRTGEHELIKESYIKFETLSLKPPTDGTGNALWARRDISDSQNLLLCSRSSIDSQMTCKSDSCRSEYFC